MVPVQFGSFQVIKGSARQIEACLPKVGTSEQMGYAPFANVEGKPNEQYWIVADGPKDVEEFVAHKPEVLSKDPTAPIDATFAAWAISKVPLYWQNGRHQLAADLA